MFENAWLIIALALTAPLWLPLIFVIIIVAILIIAAILLAPVMVIYTITNS